MFPFTEVPVDIAREILECVACTTGPSRFSVTLVSRTVQKWTDPYVLDRIIIRNNEKWDEFVAMLQEKNVTSRMKQVFPFLRILAVMPEIDESSLPITMEQLLQLFPRLEIIYISPPGSYAMHHPHAALRRIGAAFGTTWLRSLQGPDNLCLWRVTHLDLVLMSPEQWPDLVHLGLPRFHTLTHMCCDLETPSEIGEVWGHLQVLVTALPQSLLLCLVNIDFPNVEIGELRDRYDIGLDDRILLCNHEDCSGKKGGQWVLTADLLNDFEEWNGAVIERATYWSRGLDMVNRRRAESL